MQIHLYKSKEIKCKKQLKIFIRQCIKTYNIIQYHNLEAIKNVIPFNYNQPSIGLFFLGSREELNILKNNNQFLMQLKIILILPDNNLEFTKDALSLSPVHICHIDCDFEDVKQILHHIRQKSRV